ncbi:MAG: TetR family transcriptional regulator [Actinomycetota bacterium]|nr:TetR family transcriptional regulator [Actinomycetota bacterium]
MTQRETNAVAGRRRQIIEAAIASLTDVGYAGTSIREIARRGDFNSALISYYFGGLHGLLLAALDHSSSIRMQRYSEAVDQAEGLEDLVDVARRIYREDVEGGHITIFSEMVAASLAHPELAPELIARAEPWIDFVERAIRKAFGGSPLEQMLPPREVAYAIICFYLGVNLMTQLESDDARIQELFALAGRLTPILAPFVQRQ